MYVVMSLQGTYHIVILDFFLISYGLFVCLLNFLHCYKHIIRTKHVEEILMILFEV